MCVLATASALPVRGHLMQVKGLSFGDQCCFKPCILYPGCSWNLFGIICNLAYAASAPQTIKLKLPGDM